VDQTGVAKNLPGELQLERHKAIHLCNILSLDPATSDAHCAAVANPVLSAISQWSDTELNIDNSVSAALFAAPLCDNGPNTQPSKLWALYEEFQKDALSINVVDPNIANVIGAVDQISLENMFVVFYCSTLVCTEVIGFHPEYLAGLMPCKYPLSPPLCKPGK